MIVDQFDLVPRFNLGERTSAAKSRNGPAFIGTTEEAAEKLSFFCSAMVGRGLGSAWFSSTLEFWLAGVLFADTPAFASPAGTSFTIRTKLWAAAVRRNSQSIRARPRSLVWRNPATVFIQLNTLSILRRMRWLLANRGCCRSSSRNQFFQCFDTLNSATRGTTPNPRIPAMHFSSW